MLLLVDFFEAESHEAQTGFELTIVAEDNFELLFLLFPLHVLGLQVYTTTLDSIEHTYIEM